jgi:hypothetical protein
VAPEFSFEAFKNPSSACIPVFLIALKSPWPGDGGKNRSFPNLVEFNVYLGQVRPDDVEGRLGLRKRHF